MKFGSGDGHPAYSVESLAGPASYKTQLEDSHPAYQVCSPNSPRTTPRITPRTYLLELEKVGSISYPGKQLEKIFEKLTEKQTHLLDLSDKLK